MDTLYMRCLILVLPGSSSWIASHELTQSAGFSTMNISSHSVPQRIVNYFNFLSSFNFSSYSKKEKHNLYVYIYS